MPEYPFEPKSNAHLLPGQFRGVPFSDGQWACGRVLAVKTQSDAYFPGNSRMFLAALMHWQADQRPATEAIAGRQVLAQGRAHVRSIQLNGQMIPRLPRPRAGPYPRTAGGDPPWRRDGDGL